MTKELQDLINYLIEEDLDQIHLSNILKCELRRAFEILNQETEMTAEEINILKNLKIVEGV